MVMELKRESGGSNCDEANRETSSESLEVSELVTEIPEAGLLTRGKFEELFPSFWI